MLYMYPIRYAIPITILRAVYNDIIVPVTTKPAAERESKTTLYRPSGYMVGYSHRWTPFAAA